MTDIEALAKRVAEKQFPILDEPSLRSIPWAMIAPHEDQAQRNHQQSLAELARRSGLSPCEALCVLADVEWPRSWFGGVPKDLQVWTTAVLAAWSKQYSALTAAPRDAGEIADAHRRLADSLSVRAEQLRVKAGHLANKGFGPDFAAKMNDALLLANAADAIRALATVKPETPSEQQFREATEAVAAMEPWRRDEVRQEMGIKTVKP